MSTCPETGRNDKCTCAPQPCASMADATPSGVGGAEAAPDPHRGSVAANERDLRRESYRTGSDIVFNETIIKGTHGTQVTFFGCSACGSFVMDREFHRTWHAQLRREVSTAGFMPSLGSLFGGPTI